MLPARKFKENRSRDPVLTLSAANGTNIHTYGSKLLSINIGLRRSFPHQFVIAEVDRPIIGADFLSTYGLLVDLKGKQLLDSKTNLTVNAMEANVSTPSPMHQQWIWFAVERLSVFSRNSQLQFSSQAQRGSSHRYKRCTPIFKTT